jgi:hypothetical protein
MQECASKGRARGRPSYTAMIHRRPSEWSFLVTSRIPVAKCSALSPTIATGTVGKHCAVREE